MIDTQTACCVTTQLLHQMTGKIVTVTVSDTPEEHYRELSDAAKSFAPPAPTDDSGGIKSEGFIAGIGGQGAFASVSEPSTFLACTSPIGIIMEEAAKAAKANGCWFRFKMDVLVDRNIAEKADHE